jgi:thiamine-phosphate pyrophosphorylase
MFRYAITDRRSVKGEPSQSPESDRFAGLVDQAKRLAAEGVDFLQLREKDLEAKELIGVARRIITAAREGRAGDGSVLRVLVNGRPDVALAAGADGLHLPSGAEQLTVGQVRRIFAAREAIVSVACHTLAEVERASGDGADLILFSPVFGKVIPGGATLAGLGLERLSEACHAAGETPVLALGGVTLENAQACVAAGASGIAAIRFFL